MTTITQVIIISVTTSVTLSLLAFLCMILFLKLRPQRVPVLQSQRALEEGDVSYNGNNPVNSSGAEQAPQTTSLSSPYSRSGAWEALSSTESVNRQTQDNQKKSCFLDVFSTRNSRRLQKNREGDIQLETLATNSAAVEQSTSKNEDAPASHDDKGFEGDAQNGNIKTNDTSTIKSIGTSSSAITMRRVSRETIKKVDDELPNDVPEPKRRSTGTIGRDPGSPPKQPVPPVPIHFLKKSYGKRDSALELSNMSLDTAGSSILNDESITACQDDKSLDTEKAISPTLGDFYTRITDSLDLASRSQGHTVLNRRSGPACSGKISEDVESPFRSVSAPHSNRSSLGHPVQEPSSRFDSAALQARRLSYPNQFKLVQAQSLETSRAALPQSQPLRPPSVYGSKGLVVPHNSQTSSLTLPARSTLRPTTGNSRLVGTRPSSALGFSPPKSRRNSVSSLRPPIGGPPTRRGHRRQNCVRIPIFAPINNSTGLAPTAEEPEEPTEPDAFQKSSSQLQTTACQPIPDLVAEAKSKALEEDQVAPPTVKRIVDAADDKISESSRSVKCETPTETPSRENRSSVDESSDSTVGKYTPSPCPQRFTAPRRSSLRVPPNTMSRLLTAVNNSNRGNITPPNLRFTRSNDRLTFQNETVMTEGNSLVASYESNSNNSCLLRPKSMRRKLATSWDSTQRRSTIKAVSPASSKHGADADSDDDSKADTTDSEDTPRPATSNSKDLEVANTPTPLKNDNPPFVRTPGSIYDQYGFLKEWKT